MTDRNSVGLQVAQVADRLASTQIYMGGGAASYSGELTVTRLYEASRALHNQPLTYVAAKALKDAVEPGDWVVITTGFTVPPVMVAETDGPVGAAALARALVLAFRANVLILTEPETVPAMASVVKAAGLNVVDASRPRTPMRVDVSAFPIDDSQAVDETERIITQLKPKAVIAIEKPSRNSKGVYHNGAGIDMTSICAKVDHLFEEARRQNIFTIGIGDGGNEIGMGAIEETVRSILPPASNCGCPCNTGIAAATTADVCIVAGIANWGSYALEAVIAALVGNPEVLHDEALEQRIVNRACDLGMVDPTTCLTDGYVDGLPSTIGQHLISLLKATLHARLAPTGRRERFKEMMSDRDEIQALVNSW